EELRKAAEAKAEKELVSSVPRCQAERRKVAEAAAENERVEAEFKNAAEAEVGEKENRLQ
ncbi:Ces3b, partial [Symbiodinium sp. KB8]